MLLYFLLGVVTITSTVQSIFKQKFNNLGKGSSYFFSAMISAVAMLFFVLINLVYTKDWFYTPDLLIPSTSFGLAYAAATVFSVLAILYGPLAKTSLIISCSLLLPTLYGIFVQGIYIKVIRDGSATVSEALGEALSPTLIIGIILLVITLFLVNRENKDDSVEEKKVTLKWLIFVTLAFIGNGMCSTVQTAKQDFYGNDGNNMFMIVALIFVVLILLIASISTKKERAEIKYTVKHGALLAVLCGAANGITNLLVMVLNANHFPASILFPFVSGGGLVLIFLWSVLVNKEKFTVPQYIGYGLGVLSLVLLNL